MGGVSSKFRKPSPAMIVAMVALFIALSGGAYASVAINQVRSVHIKNGEVKAVDLATNAVTAAKLKANAVNGSKVADDSLTGADINEASLAGVPAAASAGGVTPKKIFFQGSGAAPVTDVEILNLGGLRLLASCAAPAALTLRAATTVGSAVVKSQIVASQTTYTDAAPAGDNRGGDQLLQDDQFDIGNLFEVLDDATTGSDGVTARVTYVAPGGSVVEANVSAEEGTLLGTAGTCLVSGFAFAG